MDDDIMPEINLVDDGDVDGTCECGECDECINGDECSCGICEECLEREEMSEDSFDDNSADDLIF